VRTIIVETANRFARDLMVQEVGYAHLREQGIDLVADSPQSFVDDTPTARLVRQVLGAIAEFDKAMTVAKLKGARDRKSAEAGRRIEGRKGFSVTPRRPWPSPGAYVARRRRRGSAALFAPSPPCWPKPGT
jgi:DNA invertase Pin-like site-specific DNA recombinase